MEKGRQRRHQRTLGSRAIVAILSLSGLFITSALQIRLSLGIRGSLVKLPVIRDAIVLLIVGRDDRGDLNRDMAAIASTEPANKERTANPWAQDGRKVELDRSVGPFLELLPRVDEVLYTSRIDVGNSREVENEGTKEWLRSVMSGGINAAPRGRFVPRTINEANGTGVFATATVCFDVMDEAIIDSGTIWVCEGLFEAVDEDTRRERLDFDVRIAST